MEALRIVLTQTSANYRREETMDNKMTYPLPPLSTIIGALHTICGYKEYKEMDISVQGKFESMHREPYTDYCFLNSIMDDRGILVKMRNGTMLSKAYEKVAAAKKSQGNSFRKGITIQVFNDNLLKEYQGLMDKSDQISVFKNMRMKPFLDQIKRRKGQISKKKGNLEKVSPAYKKLDIREKELKNLEKVAKEKLKDFERENYTIPISRFRSLTTSLKFYEILDNITLMLHVKAEKEVLDNILEHIYNLTSIGRSEDFVEVINAEIVELIEEVDKEMISPWSAYLDYNSVKEEIIYTKQELGRGINGTKYYLNKKYEIIDNKREFEKVKAIYASEYTIEETSEQIKIDHWNGQDYIVNFL